MIDETWWRKLKHLLSSVFQTAVVSDASFQIDIQTTAINWSFFIIIIIIIIISVIWINKNTKRKISVHFLFVFKKQKSLHLLLIINFMFYQISTCWCALVKRWYSLISRIKDIPPDPIRCTAEVRHIHVNPDENNSSKCSIPEPIMIAVKQSFTHSHSFGEDTDCNPAENKPLTQVNQCCIKAGVVSVVVVVASNGILSSVLSRGDRWICLRAVRRVSEWDELVALGLFCPVRWFLSRWKGFFLRSRRVSGKSWRSSLKAYDLISNSRIPADILLAFITLRNGIKSIAASAQKMFDFVPSFRPSFKTMLGAVDYVSMSMPALCSSPSPFLFLFFFFLGLLILPRLFPSQSWAFLIYWRLKIVLKFSICTHSLVTFVNMN